MCYVRLVNSQNGGQIGGEGANWPQWWHKMEAVLQAVRHKAGKCALIPLAYVKRSASSCFHIWFSLPNHNWAIYTQVTIFYAMAFLITGSVTTQLWLERRGILPSLNITQLIEIPIGNLYYIQISAETILENCVSCIMIHEISCITYSRN